MTIPVAAALVLRDRTNADHLHVLALALDALVADGTWSTGRAWRGLRRVRALRPHGTARAAEPLAAVDALLRRAAAGLLATDGRRFTITRAGEDALATAKPPAVVRPSARDDETRAAALQTLSPTARAFLKAYRNALGSDLPKSGLPTGGDNREAAWRTGTGTY